MDRNEMGIGQLAVLHDQLELHHICCSLSCEGLIAARRMAKELRFHRCRQTTSRDSAEVIAVLKQLHSSGYRNKLRLRLGMSQLRRRHGQALPIYYLVWHTARPNDVARMSSLATAV